MRFFFLAILFTGLFLQNLIASTSSSTEIFQEAQKIFETMKTTRYEHKTVIDESKGLYVVDCSAFINPLSTTEGRQLSDVGIGYQAFYKEFC